LNRIDVQAAGLSSGAEGDYWTAASLAGPTGIEESPSPPALTVQKIKSVAPLGSQFGVMEPLTVPPALREALFGQSSRPIDGCATSLLHTYAILDAAKVSCLPEMLEDSGLDYACLFNGEAAEELRNVAPYLVGLEADHEFTRNLFTKGEAGWQLWDKEPGIFIRSQARLDEIRKHLRKFTQVRTEAGSVEYFRFWESTVLDYIAFFGGADLGEEIFPGMQILWKTHYYNSGPQFTLMRVGRIQ
jgi:hypothetical protein